ncbi:MAG: hypothetical protein QMD71_06525 [bacterium]|nr:hypothetical protein [bacterium]
MNFWEVIALVLGGAGLFAGILGAFLSWASRVNGHAARELIKELSLKFGALISSEGEKTVSL